MRARTFIEQRQSESNESTKEEVAMPQLVVPLKIPNGKTVEGSRIAAISILKVKIHKIRRNGHIVKRKKKKHKKMSFTDNITKSTTSRRASNISRERRMRGKDQGTTKTATSISLNQLGFERNLSQRHTRNMNPMKSPCFTI